MGDDRLNALRQRMADHGVDVYLIPRGDAFSGEEVPAGDERLRFICGFSGSAGLAVVTQDQAALFSDGRYTLQMKAETSPAWQCFVQPEANVIDWIKSEIAQGVIGFDPWLMTVSAEKNYQSKFADSRLSLKPIEENLIDLIWPDQPPAPQSKAWDYPVLYAGLSRSDKIKAVLEDLTEASPPTPTPMQDLMITAPDQLAWLANIRGTDLPHTPVILAFAMLDASGTITIFADETQFDECDQSHLLFKPRAAILDHLSALPADKVVYDPATCPFAMARLFKGKAATAESPITLMKACKTSIEQEAIRNAHRRDAVAMVRFLAWFDAHADSGIREVDIAEKLIHYRGQIDGFISPSFSTICGSGPNGAIVHYRAKPGKDSPIIADTLCLIDSGGQYQDATTDITRTIAVGTPSAAMKRHFTIVLKGHIALDQAVFPKQTSGVQLDAITRAPLWAEGMDYAHGTGHGVGCGLNVHEGPTNISKRGTRAVEPGMLLSNEPGYYIEGQYGIRIENLILATEDTRDGFLRFEAVTLVPMDKRLMDLDVLTDGERDWINAYHQRVYEAVAPQIADEEEVLAWLKNATSPLGGA
jgi:Xaa-Pro aminopeptidase